VGELLERRREETARRIETLRKQLGEAETHCKGKACVYATGSYGRGEASKHSDLDLFIEGWYPSEYSRTAYGIFMDLWDRDFTKFMTADETRSYLR